MLLKVYHSADRCEIYLFLRNMTPQGVESICISYQILLPSVTSIHAWMGREADVSVAVTMQTKEALY